MSHENPSGTASEQHVDKRSHSSYNKNKDDHLYDDEFKIDKLYRFNRLLGNGAYGVVGAFKNEVTGEKVAIKKIKKIFTNMLLARRTLRELKILRHLGAHPNIIAMKGILLPSSPSKFEEIYVVQELMEADLHQIIQSGQELTDAHFQYFLYQILKGLFYIHSCNVIHRDLKPGNLLVNSNCELRICDFGLARGFLEPNEHKDIFMSEYVATRWYRAPEIMLSHSNYTQAIDVWSVGCIFAELIGGKVLFPGKQLVDQMNLILNICGTPSEAFTSRLKSRRSQSYLRNQPKKQKIPFATLFPRANPQAVDLLEKMLEFDPLRRISVEGALQHPYLAAHYKAKDLVQGSRFEDYAFEASETLEQMRGFIWEEMRHYHPNATPFAENTKSLQDLEASPLISCNKDQVVPLNELQGNQGSKLKEI